MSRRVDWTLDKIDNRNLEAVFIALLFALEAQNFKLDLSGISAAPNVDSSLMRPLGLRATFAGASQTLLGASSIAPVDSYRCSNSI